MYFISVIFYIHFNKKPSSLTNDNPSFLTHRELLNNNNNNNNNNKIYIQSLSIEDI